MVCFLRLLKTGILLLFAGLFSGAVLAGEVTVAVASNFLPAMREIGAQFREESGHTLRIVNGSTGTLFAQISKGAPYDVFLSADTARVAILAEAGKLLEGRGKPYALGALVLYARDKGVLADNVSASLLRDDLRHFAMADPATAPYGLAASQVLQSLELGGQVAQKAVIGANIGQTFGFVETGNAELGFVARSQAVAVGGDWLDIPPDSYEPIVQAAGLLLHARGNDAARELYDYLSSDTARALMVNAGYGVPE